MRKKAFWTAMTVLFVVWLGFSFYCIELLYIGSQVLLIVAGGFAGILISDINIARKLKKAGFEGLIPDLTMFQHKRRDREKKAQLDRHEGCSTEADPGQNEGQNPPAP